MKNHSIILSSLLALAMIASCQQEPLASPEKSDPDSVMQPIRFSTGGALDYEIMTRSDINSMKSAGFGLLGYNTTTESFNTDSPEGLVFDNYKIVSPDGEVWEYDDAVAYWNTASEDKYTFLAYHPYNEGQGVELTAFTSDRLISEYTDYIVATPIIDHTDRKNVELEFKHIFAKLMTTVKLASAYEGQSYKITKVTFSDVMDYPVFNLAKNAFTGEAVAHDVTSSSSDITGTLTTMANSVTVAPVYINPYSYATEKKDITVSFDFLYTFKDANGVTTENSFTRGITISKDFLGNRVYNINVTFTPDEEGGIELRMKLDDYSNGENLTSEMYQTPPPPPEYYPVSGSNLSANGRSNSYIVSAAGTYTFDATYKGNSSTEAVGAIDKVEVLWESAVDAVSAQDLISSVSVSGSTVSFTATDRKGNALIAAKDASNNILWSWHIWMTDAPQVHSYTTGDYKVLDRNLGAVSALKTDGTKTYGLYYQWGRKEPFVGGDNTTGSKPTASKVTSRQTSDWAVLNPTTFVAYNGNWLSTADNNRWGNGGAKTVNDPCPPGYKVPANRTIWGSSLSSNWDNTNKGHNFAGQLTDAAVICWYPAAGYLYSGDGSFSSAGSNGYDWSSSPYGSNYAYYLNLGSSNISPSSNIYYACGYAVRCVQE